MKKIAAVITLLFSFLCLNSIAVSLSDFDGTANIQSLTATSIAAGHPQTVSATVILTKKAKGENTEWKFADTNRYKYTWKITDNSKNPATTVTVIHETMNATDLLETTQAISGIVGCYSTSVHVDVNLVFGGIDNNVKTTDNNEPACLPLDSDVSDPWTVVGIEKIMYATSRTDTQGRENPGVIRFCYLSGFNQLEAIPKPAGATFPIGQPVWEFMSSTPVNVFKGIVKIGNFAALDFSKAGACSFNCKCGTSIVPIDIIVESAGVCLTIDNDTTGASFSVNCPRTIISDMGNWHGGGKVTLLYPIGSIFTSGAWMQSGANPRVKTLTLLQTSDSFSLNTSKAGTNTLAYSCNLMCGFENVCLSDSVTFTTAETIASFTEKTLFEADHEILKIEIGGYHTYQGNGQPTDHGPNITCTVDATNISVQSAKNAALVADLNNVSLVCSFVSLAICPLTVPSAVFSAVGIGDTLIANKINANTTVTKTIFGQATKTINIGQTWVVEGYISDDLLQTRLTVNADNTGSPTGGPDGFVDTSFSEIYVFARNEQKVGIRIKIVTPTN